MQIEQLLATEIDQSNPRWRLGLTRPEVAGQNDMFGDIAQTESQPNVHEVKVSDWDDDTRLFNEKETLGLYLTGHPITRYEKELRQFTECTLNNVDSLVPADTTHRYSKKNQREVRLAGLMISLRARKTQRGSKIVTAVLDDRTARIEMVMYEEVYEKFGHLLHKDKLVIVEGAVSYDDFSACYRITANSIADITQAREKFSRCLEIKVDKTRVNGSWSDEKVTAQIGDVLRTYREGQCPVCIEYISHSELSRIALGEDWKVQPSDELINRLQHLFSDEQINIRY